MLRSPLWLASLWVLVPAAHAQAYQRSTVDDVPDGTPLFWEQPTITMSLASSSAPGVEPSDARLAFLTSLRAWSRAGGCTRAVFVDGGEVSGLSTNLQRASPDMENRVVFRAEDWPAELGPETLALTSAVYRRTTGEIVDADIDLNAVDHLWSASTPPLEGHDDIANTLTHELGHVLGFAHSDTLDATMYARAEVAEVSKRDLAEDDIIAVCDVYPGGRRRGPQPTCSLVRQEAPAAPSALVLGALGLLATVRARGGLRRRASR
jgi:hypothetical protein